MSESYQPAAKFNQFFLCCQCTFAAALCLRGPGALLNFPKLASSLPRPLDLSDKGIQAASNEAAKRFSRELKSQRRLYRLHTSTQGANSPMPNTTTSDQAQSGAQSFCQLTSRDAGTATCSLIPSRPALSTCKMELKNSGEYFSAKNQPRLPAPLKPPPTSYIAREYPMRVFRSTLPERAAGEHSCFQATNHPVSTFGAGSRSQAVRLKLEETSDDGLSAAALMHAPIGEEFERLSCPEMLDSLFLDERFMSSTDRKLQQLQPVTMATASEILCLEKGMQFLEEDMMFDNVNLPGFVASMYDGLCLAPPPPQAHGHTLDGDEGIHNSTTWEACLWSF